MNSIVTGHLLYTVNYNWQPNVSFTLGYLGKTISVNIDNFSILNLEALLNAAGIVSAKIRDMRVFGSSLEKRVEIFFAYEGTNANKRPEFYLSNGKHKFGSYAAVSGLIIPAFTKVLTGLEAVCLNIAQNYFLDSFMVKPISMPALPGLILNNQPVNGTLADMRNINDSYIFVDEFKRLNWQIIWYKDASGKVIGIQRPKTGW